LVYSQVSIFANMEEREENLVLMQATSWARNHRHLWAQTKVYVKRNRKDKVRHSTT
jgi:hypothetical protein